MQMEDGDRAARLSILHSSSIDGFGVSISEIVDCVFIHAEVVRDLV